MYVKIFWLSLRFIRTSMQVFQRVFGSLVNGDPQPPPQRVNRPSPFFNFLVSILKSPKSQLYDKFWSGNMSGTLWVTEKKKISFVFFIQQWDHLFFWIYFHQLKYFHRDNFLNYFGVKVQSAYSGLISGFRFVAFVTEFHYPSFCGGWHNPENITGS